jgi:hypothetical protein
MAAPHPPEAAREAVRKGKSMKEPKKEVPSLAVSDPSAGAVCHS